MSSIQESNHSQLELFRNKSALDLFLRQMSEEVTRTIGLPISPKIALRVELILISLPDLELRGTYDSQRSRNVLISLVARQVQEVIRAKGITRLASAIRFEEQRDALLIGYHLVIEIWY